MPARPDAIRCVTVRSQGKLELIEAVGNICRRLSLPRTVGQIYGLLYLSSRALSLEEIAEQLGISKASASTGTRQLASFGALRKTWVPGSRKDHFEAIPEIGGLVRNAYREIIRPRLAAAEQKVGRVAQSLESDLTGGVLTLDEFQFCQKRLRSLGQIQQKLKALAPFLDRLV